jgi:hypothetical protein
VDFLHYHESPKVPSSEFFSLDWDPPEATSRRNFRKLQEAERGARFVDVLVTLELLFMREEFHANRTLATILQLNVLRMASRVHKLNDST